MNARAIAVLFLVLSLALAPVLLASPARAQAQYSERLDVYAAGQDAYWLMKFDQLNSSLPSLTSAESSATGVSGYTLVAISTQGEVSNLQLFGSSGYNVLGLPYYPSQGLFLTVNASGPSAASSLLNYFGTKFGTSFSQISSSSGSTVYFAPVQFGSIAAPFLFKLVPTSQGGFAAFITESALLGLPMPVIELSGSNSGTGFDHTIAVGAATTSFAASTGSVDLSEIIGSTNATLTAASKSGSSEVVIHSLDGLVISSDKSATVSNSLTSFSGSYTLQVAAGARVLVNASLESAPETALAYRILDHGSLTDGNDLSVTIFVKNTAKTGSIQNVVVNDSWWQKYPTVFQLSKGNYSFTIPAITAGSTYNASYVLSVVSSAAQQIVIPSAPVTYQYGLSTGSFNGTVGLGENVVQVNSVGPAIAVTAQSTLSSGAALGTTGDYTVTVTNNGNSPAFNVKLDNYTVGSLAQDGGTQTFSIPISLSSLSQANLSRSFSIQYSNSAGQSQNLTANTVKLVLSHNAMVIPFVTVSTADNVNAGSLSSGLMNVTYDFTNGGKADSGVAATETFPSGVQCKVATGQGGTCSGNTLTLNIPVLNTTAYSTTVQLNFTKDNFVIPGTVVTAAYDGLELSTYGQTYVIPAGISVTKTFSPDFGFPSSQSTVVVGVSNVGTVPVFNVTVSAGADSFDSSPTGTTQQTYATISPKQSQSFNYTVTLTSGSLGNLTAEPVSTSFIFAGASQELSLGAATFSVLGPVVVYVTSFPTAPEENHNFTLNITLANPSSVTVSNVTYTLTIPPGLSVISGGSVSGHILTVSVPTLAPKSNSTVRLNLMANTYMTISTADSHLTFQYLGSTLSGTLPTLSVVVGIDVTTRYILPMVIAVFVALAAVVYVRRRVGTVASP